MSKSKGNGVDPLKTIDEIGVDMARILLLRAAAPRSDVDWSHKGNIVCLKLSILLLIV